MGRPAATVSSTSASTARSTRRLASSGSRSSTGWSRRNSPSSTSDIVATAVIGLVSDAMRKMADRSRGVRSAKDGEPMVSMWTASPRAPRGTRPGISVERIRRRHVRMQLAGAPPRDQLLDVPKMVLGLPPDEPAPEDTDDVAALEQCQIQRDRRDLAGGEADDEEATLPGGGAQGGLAVRTTDRVVHDVSPGTAGELADP